MIQYLRLLARFHFDRRAVTALEYGLIAASVVAIGLAGFSVLEGSLSDKFNAIAADLT